MRGDGEAAATGRSPTFAIVTILLAGVLAGAQLGKIALVVPWYQAELGLSLTVIGWLTAILGVFVAAVALPTGLLIDRWGLRLSFLCGAALMGVGGIALAAFDQAPWVVIARVVEGAGYLLIVIAAPALLATITPPRSKAAVLAIWGGFVPAGFAVAAFVAGGAIIESAGWGAMGLLLAAAAAGGVALLIPRPRPRRSTV